MEMIKSFSQTHGYVTTGAAAIGVVASVDILINISTSKKRIEDLSQALFYGLASLNLFPGSARIGAAVCVLHTINFIRNCNKDDSHDEDDSKEHHYHEKLIGIFLVGAPAVFIHDSASNKLLLALILLRIALNNPESVKTQGSNAISTILKGGSKLYQSLSSSQNA